MLVEDRRGDAAHAEGAFLVVERPAVPTPLHEFAQEFAEIGDRVLGEAFEPPERTDLTHAVLGELCQQRLADARGMHRAAAPGAEEGAQRVMAFDLRDEHHLAIVLDAEIDGLAAGLHQRMHGGAPHVRHAAVAQEGRAGLEGADADQPDAAFHVVLDVSAALQRQQDAVRRGGRDARAPAEFAQCQAVLVGQDLKQRQPAIERLDRSARESGLQRARPPSPLALLDQALAPSAIDTGTVADHRRPVVAKSKRNYFA